MRTNRDLGKRKIEVERGKKVNGVLQFKSTERGPTCVQKIQIAKRGGVSPEIL